MADLFDEVDVTWRMDGEEPALDDRLGFQLVQMHAFPIEVAEFNGKIGERIARGDHAGFAHGAMNGADAIRALGMMGAGLVFDEARAGAESDHRLAYMILRIPIQ